MLPSIISQAQLAALTALARRAPAGAFAEVGVYRGGSALLLYEIAQEQGRTLHLFDTFTGTPFYTEAVDHHKPGPEFAAADAPDYIRLLMPRAELHIGVYPETHPAGLRDLAFVHCDCDQYLSYRAVIDRMWSLVVPGGFLLFDDYPYLKGAKRAVEESFEPAALQKAGQRFFVQKAAA